MPLLKPLFMIKKRFIFLSLSVSLLLVVSGVRAQSPVPVQPSIPGQSPVPVQPSVPGQSPIPAKAVLSRWSIGFSAGPSFPVGKYGYKKFPDNEAGYAQTGYGAEIFLGYRLNRSFGAVLVMNGQENATTNSPQHRPILYPPTPNFNYTTTVDFHSHNWKIARFLAGGVFNRPLSGRGGISLQLRILAGVLKTGVPGYSSSTYNNVTSLTFSDGNVSDANTPWTFCYQGDAGLTFPLSHKAFLLANMGYAGADPVVRYPYYYTPGNLPKPVTPANTYHTGTVHLRIGVGVDL
jgi:hypothetical protein